MARSTPARGKHFTTRANTNATDSQHASASTSASASPPASSRTRNALARGGRAAVRLLPLSDRASVPTPVRWPSPGSYGGPGSNADSELVESSSLSGRPSLLLNEQFTSSNVRRSDVSNKGESLNSAGASGGDQHLRSDISNPDDASGRSLDHHSDKFDSPDIPESPGTPDRSQYRHSNISNSAYGSDRSSDLSSDHHSDALGDSDIPNSSHGSDWSSSHPGGDTSRPPRPKCIPRVLSIVLSLLAPFVVFGICRHVRVRVALPCHIQENPNLLVPCAIAVDLNRALSAVPQHVGPADPNNVFRHKVSDELYYDQHTPLSGLGVSKNRYSINHKTQMTRKDELRGRLESAIDKLDNRRLLLESTWLQRLLGVKTDKEAERTQVNALVSLANNTFFQVYGFVSFVWRNEQQQKITAYTRTLVQQKLQQQHWINADVHQLWATRMEVDSAITTERLVTLRQSLLRVLFAEAVLVCWLEGVDSIQTQRERLSQQIWKDGQDFLHRIEGLSTSDEVHEIVRKQLSTWSNDLDRITAEGEEAALKVERSRAKRWAKQRLGHCVASGTAAGAANANASSHAFTDVESPALRRRQLSSPHWCRHWQFLDPAGVGCISHPDPMLWEWHNAIPITLVKPQETLNPAAAAPATGVAKQEDNFCIFTKEQFSRFWTHRVITHADISRYVKVEGGSLGVTIGLDEAIPFGMGPLRFVKGWGGCDEYRRGT